MAGADGGAPKRTWQEVTEALSHEHDPLKLHALIKELNHLLLEEERRKVMQRLGLRRTQPPP